MDNNNYDKPDNIIVVFKKSAKGDWEARTTAVLFLGVMVGAPISFIGIHSLTPHWLTYLGMGIMVAGMGAGLYCKIKDFKNKGLM